MVVDTGKAGLPRHSIRHTASSVVAAPCHVLASLCLLAVLMAGLSISHASEDELDTIEILADALPQTGDVVDEEYTGSHQRIQGTAVERRDVDLADLLSHETGVQTRQTGGFGTFASLTLRAASSAQTGVFLDGIPLNSAAHAGVDLSTLELLNVETVDVYRGSTPLQLGYAALGGAVNLTTRSANQPGNRLLLGVGSFGMRQLQFAHQSSHRSWDVVTTLSRQQSRNDFSFVDDNGTPLNARDDRREHRNNADALRSGLLSRLAYRWNDRSQSSVLLQLSQRELGVPELRNAEDNIAAYDTESLQFQASHSLDGLGAWNSRHTLYQHRLDDRFDDRLNQIGLAVQLVETENRVNGLRSYWEYLGAANTLGLNVDVRDETLDSRNLLNSSSNFTATRSSITTRAQFNTYLGNSRWLLTPALQWQGVSDRYDGTSRNASTSRSVAEITPQLGVRYNASNALELHANIGRYQREPSFNELFGNRGLVVGSTNLDAERGLNADLGASWQVHSSWRLDASVFGSDRQELITTVFDSIGIGHTINAGKARVLGVELGNQWQATQAWSLRTNVTWQDAYSREVNPSLDRKQLPGEARFAAYAQLQYKAGPWRSWYEVDALSERFYDQANLLRADDQTVHNVGLELRRGHWLGSISLTNLTNDNVQDFNGFPRAGRAVLLNLRYSPQPRT